MSRLTISFWREITSRHEGPWAMSRKPSSSTQQAIDIDPGYALAWARLASAYLNEEILKDRHRRNQNRRVLDALDHAIRLDPNLAWAYYTRAGFEMKVTWNWAAATGGHGTCARNRPPI